MSEAAVKTFEDVTLSTEDKYRMYEESVQEASEQAGLFEQFYREIREKKPSVMREDFCGTFLISAEWVKRDPAYSAIALDIDPEPLAYGEHHHWMPLNPEQRDRLRFLKRNVLWGTKTQADLITVCNFSFYCLKQRAQLVQYFKTCLEGLEDDGMLVLEMVGGPGFIEVPYKEHRTL